MCIRDRHKNIVFLINRSRLRHIDSKPLPHSQIPHAGMEIDLDLSVAAFHHHSLGTAAEQG